MQSRWPFLLLFLLWLAVSPAMAAQGSGCEWSNPGHDPYMGDIPSAVDHYTDIPVATRNRLKDRMRRLAYDDMATIRSNRIEGRNSYEPAIRDMHFGEGRTCSEVTRNSWPADHTERGLVYCENGFCILVPFVCRNVSRIWQQPATAPAAPAAPAAPTAVSGPTPAPVPSAMQQLPPPPPAWPPAEILPGSSLALSTLLLPPQRPLFPSRIYFPDEPAIAFYPPSVMPPLMQPPVPPVFPPAFPPDLPRVTPPLPPGPLVPVSPVPEPGAGLLLGTGLLMLLAQAWKQGRREMRQGPE